MKESEKKVIELFKANTKEKQPSSSSGVLINGNGNIIGNNNSIIHTEKIIKKTKYVLKQGEEHITEAEARILYDLVHKIYELESLIRKSPKTMRDIWSSLNRHCNVTTYKAIAKNDFEKANKYLRKWIGRLNSAPSAKKKNPEWRKQKYTAIHSICSRYGVKDKKDAYIKKNFSATSLTELNDDDLEKTYRYLTAQKK